MKQRVLYKVQKITLVTKCFTCNPVKAETYSRDGYIVTARIDKVLGSD